MYENEQPEIVAALNKITGALNVLVATLGDIKYAQLRQAEALEKIVGRLNVYDLHADLEQTDSDIKNNETVY